MPIPKEKLYLVEVNEDKIKRTWFATSFYIDRYMVFHWRMWRPFFTHELNNIRVAKIGEGGKCQAK
jgi:hypothetical protein